MLHDVNVDRRMSEVDWAPARASVVVVNNRIERQPRAHM